MNVDVFETADSTMKKMDNVDSFRTAQTLFRRRLWLRNILLISGLHLLLPSPSARQLDVLRFNIKLLSRFF